MTQHPTPQQPTTALVVDYVYESLRHHDYLVPHARKAAEDVVAVLVKMGVLTQRQAPSSLSSVVGKADTP